MERLFQNIWTTELSRALCLTLLHSLWQGLLLALLAAFMIQLSPKTSPGKRYNRFALLLGLFAFANGITFLLCFRHAGTGDFSHTLAATAEAQGVTDTLQMLWMQLAGFIDRNAAVLSLLWLALFTFRSIRLAQEARSLRGLRKSAHHLQHDYWTERLAVLKARLGIRDEVVLRESSRLQSPSVVGILKPVILLPLGMISQLPPEQVEAILLHELAHIRRRDYLVNLVQTLLEAIFFFNPFLRWLSAQLRIERENCCDEMALAVSGNKVALVNALLSFGQLQLAPGNALAMALGGRKTALLDRVKRIASSRNKSLNKTEKSFLVLFSLALFSFLCSFSWNMQRLNSSNKDKSRNLQQEPIHITPGCGGYTAGSMPQGRADRVLVRRTLKRASHTETQTTVITTINEQPGTDTLTLNQHIITDLARAGIVAEDRLLSYKLNDDELVVNGIKQPATLHHKLKNKYVKNPGWAIRYDLETSTDTAPGPFTENSNTGHTDLDQLS